MTIFERFSADIDALNVHFDRMLDEKRVMLAALHEVEEYLDNRADVDDGIPNDAMRCLVEVRAAIAKVERKAP